MRLTRKNKKFIGKVFNNKTIKEKYSNEFDLSETLIRLSEIVESDRPIELMVSAEFIKAVVKEINHLNNEIEVLTQTEDN